MSSTTAVPSAAPAVSTVWLEVEKGFWVGSTDAAFVGTIELRDGVFHARDLAAARVGDFATRAEAQAAIASAGAVERAAIL
ncbi:hypothetical protein [Agreia sp. COWG]|uniref:hypothetical protein n=1 Tax=Agreia sp. COWG TaxID=2773266 RepID=UPI001925A0A3|nr:hypothetical protein [Agreia sp. COWG]CAD5991166.1 conserved protein of unknown function [Agreia sp. COWG]